MSDPKPGPPPATKRSRAWLGWAIVALGAALVATSFAFSSGDGAPSNGGGERLAPVSVAVVSRAAITEASRYPGELDADAADVSSFYTGRLIAVRVRVGDTVEAGAVLAELDPVDAQEQIAQAQAQAKAAAADEQRAKVERDAAAAELVRAEALVKEQLISPLELDKQRARAQALSAAVESAAAGGTEARARVRLLQRRIVESVVRAPFAGRIAERYVDPGAIVAAGARLVRLVQVSPLRVRFEVPQHEVAGLAAGVRLQVTTHGRTPSANPPGAPAVAASASPSAGAAAPSAASSIGPSSAAPPAPAAGVSATVTGVGSEVSRDRRVATVEALIEAPPAGWLPGMFAEAVVVRRTIEEATVIPGIAVLSRLQPSGTVQTGVFVADDGVARWVPVVVIAREGERMAVDSALAPGTPVLVAGHADLTDGTRVKVTDDSSSPTGTR
jgi:RND family efflux transporter MFP subunit